MYKSVFRSTLVTHKSHKKPLNMRFVVLKEIIQNRTKNLQKTLKALCFGGFFILEIFKVLQKVRYIERCTSAQKMVILYQKSPVLSCRRKNRVFQRRCISDSYDIPAISVGGRELYCRMLCNAWDCFKCL